MTDVTGNRTLAARARDLAGHAAPGSLERKAAAVAVVALGTTRTVRAARAVIDGWDGPQEIRAAALAVLEQLASNEPKE